MKNWQKLLSLIAFFMFTCSMVFAQAPIRGKVIDEDGNPIPGVNIVIEGTTRGAVTDLEGLFSIQAVPGQNLEIRFVGMKSQIIEIQSTELFLDVTLEQDIQALEEIIVVGYGTQKKESVVGAIGTAKGEDLKLQGNVSSLRDALSGAIPGVAILPTSGLAGRGDERIYRETEILIRGKTTWNDASPLILVDGIERDMNDINVTEVESISVLKDASATAVFGVKGGNGVILITTKRGIAGKAKFSFEGEMSMESPSRIVEGAGTVNSIVALNHAIERTRRIWGNNASLDSYYSDEVVEYYRNGTYPYAFPDNDWLDIMFKDFATSYRLNADVRGGTERVKYFASVGYNRYGDLLDGKDVGQGYTPAYNYDRLNMRSNFDVKITSSTTLQANFSGIYSDRSYATTTSLNKIFDGLVDQPGNSQVLMYEDGMYGAYNYDLSVANPVYAFHYAGIRRELRTTMNMDYTLTQKLDFITEGLSFSAKLAYDNLFVNEGPRIRTNGLITKTIDPEFYLRGGYYDKEAEVYMLGGEPVYDMAATGWAVYDEGSGSSAGFGWVKLPNDYDPEDLDLGKSLRTLYYETRMNYARNFNKHGVSGLAMFSRQESEKGSNWPSKREDWVGRLTYDYGQRYFLEVNGAYNGSEKFGPKYRFDLFPSVAAGWMISNERFLQQAADWLDKLKVRFSMGLVGNDRVKTGSTWPYLTIYGLDEAETGPDVTDVDYSRLGYPVSNYEYISYVEGIPGNPDLRWEKAKKQNLGLDLALLRNKIMFTMDLFNEYRYDMLLAADERGVPVISGKPATAANVGEAKSKGMEFEFTYRNSSRNNKLNYWVTTNWSVARSEVIFKETPELVPKYQADEGFPLNQTRTGISTGFINSWDDLYTSTGSSVIDETQHLMPGDLVMLDFDADGAYESNDDKVPYSYPVYPQNNYSFSLGADYAGLQFSIQFVGAYNVTRRISTPMFFQKNAYVPAFILEDTWTKAYNISDPTYPALALSDKYSPDGHYRYFDGSFLRCSSVQLAYNLPQRWTKSLSIENVKFYINGRNLLLWTRMPDDGVGADQDAKNYPVKKQVNIGINIQL
ncbi:SusC/RagA family TonB-linked outer membrane protein [Bacteroidota bacterium]